MDLSGFENQFKESFKIEQIQSQLETNFFNLINDIDNVEIKNHLDFLLKEDDSSLQFSGINIHILNSDSRKPYFLARLDIYSKSSMKLIAWYDIEYGANGEILDDYMDFY